MGPPRPVQAHATQPDNLTGQRRCVKLRQWVGRCVQYPKNDQPQRLQGRRTVARPMLERKPEHSDEPRGWVLHAPQSFLGKRFDEALIGAITT